MEDVGNQIKTELKNQIVSHLAKVDKRRLEMSKTLKQWTDR